MTIECWTLLFSALTLVSASGLGLLNLNRQQVLFDKGRHQAKTDRDLAELRSLRGFVSKLNTTLADISETLTNWGYGIVTPDPSSPQAAEVMLSSADKLSGLARDYSKLRDSPEFASLKTYMTKELKKGLDSYSDIGSELLEVVKKAADGTLDTKAKSEALIMASVLIGVRARVFAEVFGFLESQLRKD